MAVGLSLVGTSGAKEEKGDGERGGGGKGRGERKKDTWEGGGREKMGKGRVRRRGREESDR